MAVGASVCLLMSSVQYVCASPTLPRSAPIDAAYTCDGHIALPQHFSHRTALGLFSAGGEGQVGDAAAYGTGHGKSVGKIVALCGHGCRLFVLEEKTIGGVRLRVLE